MAVRQPLITLVTAGIAPGLKARGFRKKALTFSRRVGKTRQLITFEGSRGAGDFYVNVGLVFDEVEALGADDVGNLIIGGQTVHLGGGLEEFVRGLPARHVPGPASGAALWRGLERLLDEWDAVVDARSALRTLDLGDGFTRVLRAQLKWVSGDRPGAKKDLAHVAREFSDRQGTSVAELAERAGIG
ncbi:MAG: DUF4304 domain-containing protein [Myxococcaceae bacterium]|nr:DUF4304 domain-containing protein [Myxococcaceae bacterium]